MAMLLFLDWRSLLFYSVLLYFWKNQSLQVFNERPKMEYEGQCLALLTFSTNYHHILELNSMYTDVDDDMGFMRTRMMIM